MSTQVDELEFSEEEIEAEIRRQDEESLRELVERARLRAREKAIEALREQRAA